MNKVIFGDCRDTMRDLKAQGVADGAKYVNRHTPDAAAFGFTQEQLQRFAELVRAEALEEAMRVLEFHGFDDAIPYVKWAAVNGRSKT